MRIRTPIRHCLPLPCEPRTPPCSLFAFRPFRRVVGAPRPVAFRTTRWSTLHHSIHTHARSGGWAVAMAFCTTASGPVLRVAQHMLFASIATVPMLATLLKIRLHLRRCPRSWWAGQPPPGRYRRGDVSHGRFPLYWRPPVTAMFAFLYLAYGCCSSAIQCSGMIRHSRSDRNILWRLLMNRRANCTWGVCNFAAHGHHTYPFHTHSVLGGVAIADAHFCFNTVALSDKPVATEHSGYLFLF